MTRVVGDDVVVKLLCSQVGSPLKAVSREVNERNAPDTHM